LDRHNEQDDKSNSDAAYIGIKVISKLDTVSND